MESNDFVLRNSDVGRFAVLSSSATQIEWKLKIEVNGGFYKKENPGIWSLFKKVINGMDIKVTYWESQLFIGETWPWTKYLRLYCNLADFVQPSNIDNIHFCMPSKIFEELQQNKFWRLWRNLNGTFSVSRDLCCSFIFNLLNLVNKSHRKSGLFENQQSGQKPLPLLANNCWEIC